MLPFQQRFAERGTLAMQQVFDPAQIAELHREYSRQFQAKLTADGRRLEDPHLNVGDRRIMLSVELTGPFLDPALYANPLVRAVIDSFLGKTVVIDSLVVVTALPGAEEQHIHRDVPPLFPEAVASIGGNPPHSIAVAIPLIDLDEQTGTTRMFAGSHHADDVEPDHEEVLAYGRAGDCYLMDARLFHCGTPNRSSRPRPIIYITYARPWFIDPVNFRKQARLTIAPAALAKIPPQHRDLFVRLAAKGALDRSPKELFS